MQNNVLGRSPDRSSRRLSACASGLSPQRVRTRLIHLDEVLRQLFYVGMSNSCANRLVVFGGDFRLMSSTYRANAVVFDSLLEINLRLILQKTGNSRYSFGIRYHRRKKMISTCRKKECSRSGIAPFQVPHNRNGYLFLSHSAKAAFVFFERPKIGTLSGMFAQGRTAQFQYRLPD